MKKRRPPHDPHTFLDPEVLLHAYSMGIFPMGEEESEEIHWFRPDPRAIVPLDAFHTPRRLGRTLRRALFDVTYDKAFGEVIAGCAEDRPVWITPPIVRAYTGLHEIGHAHSVEVWQGRELVGGLYGVQLGGAFMGESMFHRRTDASKVALVKLVDRLRERGFQIFEVQYLTDHLEQFGAVEISLEEYLARLAVAQTANCRFD